jgi:hypothetical protein
VFDNITPAATVDEGHNWLNLTYGPLTLSRPATVTNPTAPEMMVASATVGSTSGAYSIPATSAAVNNGAAAGAPTRDFFGNPRPAVANTAVDIGAVEFQGPGTPLAAASVTGGPLNFGSVATGTTSASQQLVLHNNGAATLTGITLVFAPAGRYSRPAGLAAGSCGATLTVAAGTCTINVVFSPNAAGPVPGTLTITVSNPGVTVTGSPVTLNGTGVAQGTLSFTSATNATLTHPLGGNLLNFGSPAGRAVTTSVVTVTVGVAPVTITADAVNNLIGTNFALTATTCPATPIAVGGTCTFSVRYTPPAAIPFIPRAGTLSVTDNAAGSPQILLLGGQ